MKYLLTSLMTIAVAAVFVLAPQSAQAASRYWQSTISTPAGIQNSRSFNVDFTTLSTVASDNFNVELYQNGSMIASTSTTSSYGDSGVFNVTVPADGNYSYFVRTTNQGVAETRNSSTKQVTVDATAPAAPTYQGKTRNGNTYTVTFTAPADGDVTQVRIYSSTNTTFTANAATQVGTVAVTPGQQASFTYTAPDGQERFHAVQSFDNASNGSAASGDPNTNVTVVAPAGGIGGAGVAPGAIIVPAGAGGVAGGGAVAGAQDAADDGEVDADGTSNTGVTQSDGDVLGSEDQAAATSADAANSQWVAYVIIAAVILAAVAYRFRDRIAGFFKRG